MNECCELLAIVNEKPQEQKKRKISMPTGRNVGEGEERTYFYFENRKYYDG